MKFWGIPWVYPGRTPTWMESPNVKVGDAGDCLAKAPSVLIRTVTEGKVPIGMRTDKDRL